MLQGPASPWGWCAGVVADSQMQGRTCSYPARSKKVGGTGAASAPGISHLPGDGNEPRPGQDNSPCVDLTEQSQCPGTGLQDGRSCLGGSRRELHLKVAPLDQRLSLTMATSQHLGASPHITCCAHLALGLRGPNPQDLGCSQTLYTYY